MSDLVKRLRFGNTDSTTMNSAADRIERLERENAALKIENSTLRNVAVALEVDERAKKAEAENAALTHENHELCAHNVELVALREKAEAENAALRGALNYARNGLEEIANPHFKNSSRTAAKMLIQHIDAAIDAARKP